MVTRMRDVEDDATEVRCSMEALPGFGISPEISPLQTGSPAAGQSPRPSDAAFVEIYLGQKATLQSRLVTIGAETARDASALREGETTTEELGRCQELIGPVQGKLSGHGKVSKSGEPSVIEPELIDKRTSASLEISDPTGSKTALAPLLDLSVADHLYAGGDTRNGDDLPDDSDFEHPVAIAIQALTNSDVARAVRSAEVGELKQLRAAEGSQAKQPFAPGDLYQMSRAEIISESASQEKLRLSDGSISRRRSMEAVRNSGQLHRLGDLLISQSGSAVQPGSKSEGPQRHMNDAVINWSEHLLVSAKPFGRGEQSETGPRSSSKQQLAIPGGSEPFSRTISNLADEATLASRTAAQFQPGLRQQAQHPRSSEMSDPQSLVSPGTNGTSPGAFLAAQHPPNMSRVSAAEVASTNGRIDPSFNRESTDTPQPRLETSLVASHTGADLQTLKPDIGRVPMQQAVEQLLRHPARSVEISLHPRELGRVHMMLSASDAGLTLTITAERSETLDLMRRHIDQLAQEFRNMGHGDVGFAFRQGGASRQETPRQGGLMIELSEEVELASDHVVPTPIRPSGLDLRL